MNRDKDTDLIWDWWDGEVWPHTRISTTYVMNPIPFLEGAVLSSCLRDPWSELVTVGSGWSNMLFGFWKYEEKKLFNCFISENNVCTVVYDRDWYGVDGLQPWYSALHYYLHVCHCWHCSLLVFSPQNQTATVTASWVTWAMTSCLRCCTRWWERLVKSGVVPHHSYKTSAFI